MMSKRGFAFAFGKRGVPLYLTALVQVGLGLSGCGPTPPGPSLIEDRVEDAVTRGVPLFRLFHGGTGDHFYTTSVDERDYAVSLGYRFEGIEAHVHARPRLDTTPLYRWFNPGNGDHFYTTSDVGSIAGYVYEGVACHVLRARAPGSVSLFRWYNPSTGDHFYTKALRTEIAGYVYEGVEGYVYAPERTIMVFAHQDDDLLWMLPYFGESDLLVYAAMPYTPTHAALVEQLPLDYAAEWRHPWSQVSEATFWDTYLNPCARRSIITVEAIKQRIDRFISDGAVRRIITHNNWGEYGHIHHRMVNQAVRELAVRYGKDVWALASSADASGPGRGYPDHGSLGLASVSRTFDHATFQAFKTKYQNTRLAGYGWDLWSWHDGDDEYPTGTRTFIQIVDHGVDLTVGHPRIRALEEATPVRGLAEPGTCP